MSKGTDPIAWWKWDPDYYPIGHPLRKEHLKRIAEFLYLDSLIGMSSADGSYSVTVRKED